MPGLVAFGRYRLERRLAVGGMAEILLARVTDADGLEKRVVIKRVLPSRAGDHRYVNMLADEARLAARLVHPNIVQTFDFGEVDGQTYIAMEYLVGDDLEQLIEQAVTRERQIDFGVACYVATEVAEGLHHAHVAVDESGTPLHVVHRDVSPANVIVTSGGTIKIVDFGIAKHDMAVNATESGIIKGKIAYMSPEQTRGLDLDGRSDVFSLGAVLYELLTLKPCFKGGSLPATIDAIRHAEFEPVRRLRPDVPVSVERALSSMLAPDRDARCPSAAEAARALRKALGERGLPTPREVKEHLATLTERTIQVSPRVLGTFAEPSVMVSEPFAAPDMVLDSQTVQTALNFGDTILDVRPLAPLPDASPAAPMPAAAVATVPQPHEPQPRAPLPSPFDADPTDRESDADIQFTYGTPPDTRIVSRMLLSMQRWGLEGFYNRMRLYDAELRHFLSRQSPLVFVAVALLALCFGLGLTVALRSGGSKPTVTTVEPVDPETLKAQAPTPTGRLKLDTVPPGARVTVNGGLQPGVTPMTVESIPTGVTQSVTFELKGYRSFTQELTLEPADGGRMYFLANLVPDETGAVADSAEPASPVPPPSTDAGTVEPTDAAADAAVDGTSDAAATARPGPAAAVTPAPSSRPGRGPRHRDRDAEPGVLVLDTEPAFEVRINKRSLGRTPIKGVKLPAGTHSVQLVDVDYAKTVEITIRPGKTTTSRIVLEKGKLLIDVRPWADVYIHNRKIGTTPLPPHELVEGDYRVRIVNPDMGVDRSLPVTVRRGRTARLVEKL